MRFLSVARLATVGSLACASAAWSQDAIVASPPPQSLNRSMSATDPNRDPSWDWTLNDTYDLVTTGQTYSSVRLPYYGNAGPASVLNVGGDRDIERGDGWTLLLRDFGPGAVQAFFVLYNRYRGLMRVFYYHPDNLHSHAIGKLSFQQATASKSAALLTLSDGTDRYLTTYGPERTVVSLGAMGNGWCYLDFDVSGYDPELHLKEDPSFLIQITGVTETDLVLNGEIDLVQRTVATQRDGSDGFDATDVVDAYTKVAQRYKDVEDARERYEKMARQQTRSWFADFILHTLGGLASKQWLSALGPVAGLLELVIGGGSGSGRQPAPLIFDGEIELEGRMTTLAPLYFILMRAPGSRHLDPVNDAASNVLPLYDVPLGLFNVGSEPTYRVHSRVRREGDPREYRVSYRATLESVNSVPLVVEANLHVFDVTSARAAYVLPASLTDSSRYRDIGTFNSSIVSDTYRVTVPRGQVPSFRRTLAVEVTLTPRDAAPGLEPVTVLKTYDPSHSTTRGAAPPATFPPARPSSLVAAAVSDNQIELEWIDNAGNESGFLVERRAGPTGKWVQLGAVSANETAYTDGGLGPETAYEYRVRSRHDSLGPSAYSNVARATTLPLPR
jgi:hypothetical protein